MEIYTPGKNMSCGHVTRSCKCDLLTNIESLKFNFWNYYFLDDNRAWNELFDAATQKSDLLKQADEKLSEAKSSVSKAIDKIESGRKDSTMNR